MFYGHKTCSRTCAMATEPKCSIAIEHVLWPQNIFYGHSKKSMAMVCAMAIEYIFYGHRIYIHIYIYIYPWCCIAEFNPVLLYLCSIQYWTLFYCIYHLYRFVFPIYVSEK